MQLNDSRYTNDAVRYEDLAKQEKDVYTRLRLYMIAPRTCSICRKSFSLANSLGVISRCTSRDHVDFDTETCDCFDSFTVDARMIQVLQSEGVWPSSPETLYNTVNNHGQNGLVTTSTITRIRCLLLQRRMSCLA
jgi:hypothetical protein